MQPILIIGTLTNVIVIIVVDGSAKIELYILKAIIVDAVVRDFKEECIKVILVG